MHLCQMELYFARLTLLFFGLLFLPVYGGATTWEVSNPLQELYEASFHLDASAFDRLYDSYSEMEGGEPLLHLIKDKNEFLQIIVANNEELHSRYFDESKKRLRGISMLDTRSAQFYYCQAEILLHRAFVRIHNKEYFKAARELNQAYKLLKSCKRLFPDFRLSEKGLALIHSLVGQFSGFQKTMLKLFTSLDGVSGQGTQEIEILTKWSELSSGFWRDEILMTHALIKGHVHGFWDEADALLTRVSEHRKSSLVMRWFMAQVAVKARDNEKVILLLIDQDNRQIPLFNYMLGNALLYNGDKRCVNQFNEFVERNTSQERVASAYQKLAWSVLLLEQDTSRYFQYMSKILQCEKLSREDDKQAYNEAFVIQKGRGGVPNLPLLLARLQFDGGYFADALTTLENVDHSKFRRQEQLEFFYRKGRILQELNLDAVALTSFRHVINNGQHSTAYYACNAALQSGIIHFQNQNFEKAAEYLALCLRLSPKEYKKSIHNEAKVLQGRIKRSVSAMNSVYGGG